LSGVTVGELRQIVERQHGGIATLTQTVPVRETLQGRPVWEGVVHVFDIEGHPQATRAYAWPSRIEGSDKRRFFAVLQLEAIKSPLDSVRAAIVVEYKAGQRN
jgi:hypothetical protein